MTSIDLSKLDYESLGTAVFFGAMGVVVLLWWLSRHQIQVGKLLIRLDETDAATLAAIPIAIVFADIAGHYIFLANTGRWTPGDPRASQGFVAFNVLIIVILAFLVSVVVFLSLWRLRRRKR
jgi:hypothetical protein